MATKTINVDVLAKMFLAGAQNIEAKKDYINELNVFPVPDGDTGTNMSMTIMSAAKEVTALNKPAMKDLAKREQFLLLPVELRQRQQRWQKKQMIWKCLSRLLLSMHRMY